MQINQMLIIDFVQSLKLIINLSFLSGCIKGKAYVVCLDKCFLHICFKPAIK